MIRRRHGERAARRREIILNNAAQHVPYKGKMAESHRNKAEEKMNSEKLSTNYEGVVNNPLANEQPKLNDRMKHSRATSELRISRAAA